MPYCVCAADDEARSAVVKQREAMVKFLVRADSAKERKVAAAAFEKQLQKALRGELSNLDDCASDAIVERSQLLLLPPYKKFEKEIKAAQAKSSAARAAAASAQQPMPTTPTQPVYYQQPQQQVFASPGQLVCPPGFQLTSIASPTPAPPGGGRVLSRGIAATMPGEVFPPAHFTRPCTYCKHENHTGDHCWKTYPDLRKLNGH